MLNLIVPMYRGEKQLIKGKFARMFFKNGCFVNHSKVSVFVWYQNGMTALTMRKTELVNGGHKQTEKAFLSWLRKLPSASIFELFP